MNNILLVFLGGGIGSLARYGVSEIVRSNFKSSFPIATLCSNILSCLILALVLGFFSEKADASPAIKTLIVVGFCGGFSTFSTFSNETIELLQGGFTVSLFLYIALSLLLCLAATFGGLYAGEHL